MAQYLTGVESVYINGILVTTREEVSYSLPMAIYNFAESNQGPLPNVKSWDKEVGNIAFTIIHYSGLDYISLFTQNDSFEVAINMRSGDSIIGHSCILQEIPQNTAIAGSSEVRFRTMNIEADLNL